MLLKIDSTGNKVKRKSNGDLKWAEFALRQRVTHCLLGLLSLCTIFVLVMICLIAYGKAGLATAVVSLLIAATVGCVGKLLNNAIKPLFQINR